MAIYIYIYIYIYTLYIIQSEASLAKRCASASYRHGDPTMTLVSCGAHVEQQNMLVGASKTSKLLRNWGITSVSDWWFGTWLVWLSIYWESHHPNWFSYFSEGLKPPTSQYVLWISVVCVFFCTMAFVGATSRSPSVFGDIQGVTHPAFVLGATTINYNRCLCPSIFWITIPNVNDF